MSAASLWEAVARGALRARSRSCGFCDDGLVTVDACTCDAGPALGIPGAGHRPYCGVEPCPDGCFERLSPRTAGDAA